MRRTITLLVAIATIMTVTAGTASAGRSEKSQVSKTDLCHYDADTDEYHLIRINGNAVDKHLAHGDVSPATEGLDVDCVSAAASVVVEGAFDNGQHRIGFTIYQTPAGEFSGNASHSWSSYAYTTDLTDACLDPSSSTATAWGIIASGSFAGQYAVTTIEEQADGSIWAFSRRKVTIDLAEDYFNRRCTPSEVPFGITGPGTGLLTFS